MNREAAEPFARLEERSRFDTRLGDLSSKFVNLPSSGEPRHCYFSAVQDLTERKQVEEALLLDGVVIGGGNANAFFGG